MKGLVLVVVLVLVSACATYPPPKIEGNRYQNYRHGFTVELPGEPWKPTDELPAWLKSGMIGQNAPISAIQLALFNNQTNAFVMISCIRHPCDIRLLDRDALYEAFQEEFKQIKNEALKSDQVTRYEYDIWYSGTRLHLSTEMDFKTEIQRSRLITKGYMYPIGYDTYFVTFALWSDQLTFNENLEVFDKLYKTFRASEALTKPTAE
jgi:hypothetical protein